MSPLVSRFIPLVTARRGRTALFATAAVAVTLAVALVPLGRTFADDDPIVAKVNGADIRQSDLVIAEEELNGAQLPPTEEAKRDYLVKFLSDLVMVAQAGEQKKLTDTADFKNRMKFAREKTLMEMMLQSASKTAVTDQALHEVYDQAIKQVPNEEEVKARHILVGTEEEAKAIVAEIKGGADFAKLAKEKSKDPSAQTAGGDLGYFTKEQMVPEFANAAFKLEKGQLSDPVKSQFGWHVIQVEDKRKKPVPTFEQVKPQLEQYVQRKAQAELVTKLRETAKVERVGQPAAPAATPAPATPPAK